VRSTQWFAVRGFAVVGLVLVAVVWLSATYLDHQETAMRPRVTADPVLGGWLWYDAAWYVDIANHGYFYEPNTQSSVAFFPAYPLTVRAVARVTRDTPLAAIVTTAACGLAVAWLFARWCRSRMGFGHARLGVLLLLVYPYGWFLYGAGYADALCLAATLAAFLLLEADRPLAAGLAGAIATASRPTAGAVVVGLVALTVARRANATAQGSPTATTPAARLGLRRRDFGVLVSLGGVASYCAYLWTRYGDPFAFIAVQGAPGWSQPAGWPTWLKVEFFRHLEVDPLSSSLRLVAQALVAAVFLALVPVVWRRFGAGYGFYTLAAIALPVVGSGDFQGVGRYLLGAFPVFGAAACLLAERRRARVAVLACSSASLVVLCSFFARGSYLT
jgi:hypothetical protein